MPVELADRARRDLRRLDQETRTRLQASLRNLDAKAPDLDIVPIKGHSPWLRLRVGSYRALYRPAGGGWRWVERIVDRRDLAQAVVSLR